MNRHETRRGAAKPAPQEEHSPATTTGPQGDGLGTAEPDQPSLPPGPAFGPGGADVTWREFFALPARTRTDGGQLYDAIELAPVATIDADGTCEAFESLEEIPEDLRASAFWSIYGHIPGQGVECIGDFKTRAGALEVLRRIFGDLRPL